MTIALEVGTIFQCVPVQAVWTMDPTAKCFDIVAFSYSGSALAVVTDIWTLALPIKTVLGKHSVVWFLLMVCSVVLTGHSTPSFKKPEAHAYWHVLIGFNVSKLLPFTLSAIY